MRPIQNTLFGLMFAASLGTACSPSNTTDTGTGPGDTGTTPMDGTTNSDATVPNDMGTMMLPDGNIVPVTAGTCAAPTDLDTAGTRTGMTVVYRGTTEGAPNNLHPAGGCTAHDTGESVFRYTVPAGATAVRITTEGSSFDTVVYVRTMCAQTATSVDEVCNNDSHDHAPTSTAFVLGVSAGDHLNIIVDGNPDGMTEGQTEPNPSSGDFVLTVSPVVLGAMNNPCRPMADPPTGPRCDGALGCSEGGGSDGTAICVPVVASGAMCDTRGFTNTCATGTRCSVDPTPPEGTTPPAICSAPGTAAGALCRTAEPRCNGDLVCGSGEEPMCVRQLAAGMECDLMGFSNRCATGLMCRATGDTGGATCAP